MKQWKGKGLSGWTVDAHFNHLKGVNKGILKFVATISRKPKCVKILGLKFQTLKQNK